MQVQFFWADNLPDSSQTNFFGKAVDKSKDPTKLLILGINDNLLVFRGFRSQQILKFCDPQE